jgi:Arc/MetJ-type ribon-helix-helix transcriptional regulator
MAFEKGQSGNPNGRPKGARNRNSEVVREALVKLLDENIDSLREDLAGLKGKERASLLIQLARHLTRPEIVPERLTEEQLSQILEYLKLRDDEHEKSN